VFRLSSNVLSGSGFVQIAALILFCFFVGLSQLRLDISYSPLGARSFQIKMSLENIDLYQNDNNSFTQQDFDCLTQEWELGCKQFRMVESKSFRVVEWAERGSAMHQNIRARRGMPCLGKGLRKKEEATSRLHFGSKRSLEGSSVAVGVFSSSPPKRHIFRNLHQPQLTSV
jgi:hypothetical protein